MKISILWQVILTAFFAFLFPLNSFAQSSDAQRDAMIEERFKAADKNGDGKLTLEEAKAGMPRVEANFGRIDTQKLGYIPVDQIKKMAASR